MKISRMWIIAALLGLSWQAQAAMVFTGGGSSGSTPLAASAEFSVSGDYLSIVLRNVAPSHAGQDTPTTTLTGVFFALSDNRVLTPWLATVSAGSILNPGSCNAGLCTPSTTLVGGEWGYRQTNLPGFADRGISSSGYLTSGLPGNIGNFNNNGTTGGLAGTNLHDPVSLDGINFGIVSAAPGYAPNGGLSSVPLILESVTFLLRGADGMALSSIRNVSFQYGTSLSEPNMLSDYTPASEVPLPPAAGLLLAGLAWLGVFRRRD